MKKNYEYGVIVPYCLDDPYEPTKAARVMLHFCDMEHAPDFIIGAAYGLKPLPGHEMIPDMVEKFKNDSKTRTSFVIDDHIGSAIMCAITQADLQGKSKTWVCIQNTPVSLHPEVFSFADSQISLTHSEGPESTIKMYRFLHEEKDSLLPNPDPAFNPFMHEHLFRGDLLYDLRESAAGKYLNWRPTLNWNACIAVFALGRGLFLKNWSGTKEEVQESKTSGVLIWPYLAEEFTLNVCLKPYNFCDPDDLLQYRNCEMANEAVFFTRPPYGLTSNSPLAEARYMQTYLPPYPIIDMFQMYKEDMYCYDTPVNYGHGFEYTPKPYCAPSMGFRRGNLTPNPKAPWNNYPRESIEKFFRDSSSRTHLGVFLYLLEWIDESAFWDALTTRVTVSTKLRPFLQRYAVSVVLESAQYAPIMNRLIAYLITLGKTVMSDKLVEALREYNESTDKYASLLPLIMPLSRPHEHAFLPLYSMQHFATMMLMQRCQFRKMKEGRKKQGQS